MRQRTFLVNYVREFAGEQLSQEKTVLAFKQDGKIPRFHQFFEMLINNVDDSLTVEVLIFLAYHFFIFEGLAREHERFVD